MRERKRVILSSAQLDYNLMRGTVIHEWYICTIDDDFAV